MNKVKGEPSDDSYSASCSPAVLSDSLYLFKDDNHNKMQHSEKQGETKTFLLFFGVLFFLGCRGVFSSHMDVTVLRLIHTCTSQVFHLQREEKPDICI